jgi:hypothetical protein
VLVPSKFFYASLISLGKVRSLTFRLLFLTHVLSGLTFKNWTRKERTVHYKHTSLLRHLISDGEKSFITLISVGNLVIPFSLSLVLLKNKLECLCTAWLLLAIRVSEAVVLWHFDICVDS